MKFIRYMAIAEAKRKDCPKCNFGEYNHNEVVCVTCNQDCPYITFAIPSEERIKEALNAINDNRGK